MQKEQWTEFSGVAGRVLQRSVSMGSLITGISVGLVLIAGIVLLVFAGAEKLAAPFTQVVVAFVLARFAANGLYGEWSGTVFSNVGGTWSHVSLVAARYLALTAVWLVPMSLMGVGLNRGMATGMGPGMMSSTAGAFNVIYLVAMALTPPLFLIVAVTANGFGDAFSPAHWKQSFNGRFGDLFAIYVVYTGALGIVLLLSAAPVTLALSANANFGLFLGGLSFCMLFGVSVNLLGRLCGFFACGELGLSTTESSTASAPRPGQIPASPSPVARPETQPAPAPVTAQPTAPQQPEETSMPLPSAGEDAETIALGKSIDMAPASAPEASPPTQHAAQSESVLSTQPIRQAQPTASPSTTQPLHQTAAPRPPLLDAAQRVDAAMKRFNLEPETAISALQDLQNSFAPDPHVLQALAICLYRTGQIEEGIDTANRALPLCFDRGQVQLAARLFSALRPHMAQLDLDSGRILFIATTLAKADDLAGAAKAYSAVISLDPDDAAAVKGLLQVAEEILVRKGKPEAAIKVYQYLMQHCSTSPLVEFMSQGLEEAQRELACARGGAPVA